MYTLRAPPLSPADAAVGQGHSQDSTISLPEDEQVTSPVSPQRQTVDLQSEEAK